MFTRASTCISGGNWTDDRPHFSSHPYPPQPITHGGRKIPRPYHRQNERCTLYRKIRWYTYTLVIECKRLGSSVVIKNEKNSQGTEISTVFMRFLHFHSFLRIFQWLFLWHSSWCIWMSFCFGNILLLSCGNGNPWMALPCVHVSTRSSLLF